MKLFLTPSCQVFPGPVPPPLTHPPFSPLSALCKRLMGLLTRLYSITGSHHLIVLTGLNPLMPKRYFCTSMLFILKKKQMLQGANTDLFKPLVPN